MHSTTTSRQKRPSRGKTRGSVKRSIIISALLFVTMLAVLGGASSRFFSPSSKAHASGSTGQCNNENSTQLGHERSNGGDGVIAAGRPVDESVMTVELYYCQAYDSYFGRFAYTNNNDTFPGTAYGICTLNREFVSDYGAITIEPVQDGCNQFSNTIHDGGYTDTQISQDTSPSSKWQACWTTTFNPTFNQTTCTNFFAAPGKNLPFSGL